MEKNMTPEENTYHALVLSKPFNFDIQPGVSDGHKEAADAEEQRGQDGRLPLLFFRSVPAQASTHTKSGYYMYYVYKSVFDKKY